MRSIALVAVLLATSCNHDSRERKTPGATNTGQQTTALVKAAPSPEQPPAARINECRRVRFYELLSEVTDFYAKMYHRQPTKDQYETNDEYWRRLQVWMGSAERVEGNPAPPVLYYLRIPVERAHYDADRGVLVFDSIAEVRI
ncbi:MAG TPA: hypothetical protein VFR81_15345, partial [Longimicrobium sp.]|nr:hypothetical protein [Longimicrobium sp.]